MDPDPRAEEAFRLIKSLSASEAVRLRDRLNELLGGDGEPPVGVREPREPSPESPGDEIALEMEE